VNYHYSLDSLVLVKNGASRISNWLAENENYFEFCINESNWSKWSKWLNDKTTFIYPCVCFARE